MDYSGKTVFITGSAQGIGQLLAVAFAEAGCSIIGCDLSLDSQLGTAEQVRRAGGEYHALSADLAHGEQAVKVTEEAVEIGFDILINNAGIAPSGPFDAEPFEKWAETINVNLIGLMAVTYTALPHLKSRSAAHIVNLSSVAGCTGSPGMVAYCASKFGVLGATDSLRYELKDTPISITSIHPAMVKTRMIEGVSSSSMVPTIHPEDVVQAILRAIQKTRAQVFVPGRMRWVVNIIPRLFPRFSHWVLARDPKSYGWLTAAKEIPHGG